MSTDSPSRRGGFRRAILSPIGAGVGAVVSLLIVVVATRDGQLASIAGYGAGVSAVVVAAVVIGGGTTLTFVNGDLEMQRAVRAWRIRVIVPILAAVGALTTVVYAVAAGLNPLDVGLGCVAAAVNNLSEIEGGYLKRKLRTPAITVADLVSRLAGLVVVLLGGIFSLAMATLSVLRLGALAIAGRDDPSRARMGSVAFGSTVRRAVRPKVAGLSVQLALLDRLPYVVAPFATTPLVAGTIAALLNAQQAVSGVLVSGAQTTMAARAESRTNLSWTGRFEAMTILAACVAGLCGYLLQDVILTLLHLGEDPAIASAWSLLCVTIPVGIGARVLLFRRLAERRDASALLGVSLGFVSALIMSLVALIVANDVILIAAIGLAGETVSLLIMLWPTLLRAFKGNTRESG